MKNFDIIISRNNLFFRIEITDYVSINEYLTKMKSIDKYSIDKLLSTSILWNNDKQKVNKGIYYVGIVNNRLYNILINDDGVIIDESVKTGDITEEKNIVFNLKNNEYHYSKLKHGKYYSTFYTKYYPFDLIPELSLSKEEAFDDISDVINRLESIDGIDNIINMDLLEKSIFGKNPNKVLKRINSEDKK